MPHIPGVSAGAAHAATSPKTIQAIVLGAGLLVAGGIAWFFVHLTKTKTAPNYSTGSDTAQSAPAPFQPSPLGADASAGPQPIATLAQLTAPWSSKKFAFVDPTTLEKVPAIVIHIPGAAPSRSEAYWAFSLNAPYQRCELEYVTSLSQIASKYSYRASHPMVVSPCDNTVYDPLQVGSVPSGAWVRGQVVQGGGIRPPIAINVRVQGHSLVADRIE